MAPLELKLTRAANSTSDANTLSFPMFKDMMGDFITRASSPPYNLVRSKI